MRRRNRLAVIILTLVALSGALFYIRRPTPEIRGQVLPVIAVSSTAWDTNVLPAESVSLTKGTKEGKAPLNDESLCAVRGIVLQPDGHPAAHASIRYRWSSSKIQVPVPDLSDSDPPARPAPMNTEADGRFEFRDLRRGWIVVTAEHETGRAIERVHLRLNQPVEEVFLVLAGGDYLSGMVVTRNGAAIAGARVFPLEQAGSQAFKHVIEAKAATTDEGGRFRLAWLGPGSWKLLVSADGFGSVITEEIPTGRDTARIVLDAGAMVECRVVLAGDGTPIPNVTVTLSHAVTEIDRLQAISDAEGLAEFASVGKGIYSVGIDDKTYALAEGPEEVEIDPARKQPPLTLRLIHGGRIRGRIADGNTGAGIRNVVVWANHESQRVFFSSASDAEGTYLVSGLPPGKYQVALGERIPTYPQDPKPPLEHSVVVEEGGELGGVDFILTPGATLAGVVLDTEGRPVPDATVRARNEEGPQVLAEFYTGADGRFSFGDYADGEAVNLSAETLEQKSGFQGPFLAGAPGSDSIEIVLALACSGVIAGRVIDPDGAPVACQIQAHGEDPKLGFPMLMPHAKTDFEGNFVMGGVCAGTYLLRVIPPGKSPSDLETVHIAPGESLTGLELVYDPGDLFDVSGVVVDESDAPVQGARVKASVMNASPLGLIPAKVTDEHGEFHLDGLPLGTYVLQVSARGYGDHMMTFGSDSGDGILVRLRPALSVGGSVSARDGEPVTDFTVILSLANDTESRVLRERFSNTQGIFSVSLPYSGHWLLRIEAPGFEPVHLDLGENDGGLETQDLVVVLPGAS